MSASGPKLPLTWDEITAAVGTLLVDASSYGITSAPTAPTAVTIDAFFDGAVPALPASIVVRGVTIVLRGRRVAIAKALAPHAAFTGVHEGAAIAVPAAGQGGAICCLLATTEDADRPSHFLTCGHVFAPGAINTAVMAARNPHATEVRIGTLDRNLLDVGDVSARRDAALVRLSDDGIALALHGGPGPRLVGYLNANLVFDLDAQDWRPTTHAYDESRTTPGLFNVRLSRPPWQGHEVRGLIGSIRPISSDGDSGTVLATLADAGIGSCTGHDSECSYFERIARALDSLDATYFLWSHS